MGLETIVRPINNKDFQPTARPLIEPSDDNPITIDGGTAQLISLNHSANYSWSHQSEKEVERTYDVMRIHNPDDEDQFVDDEVVKKIKLRGADGNIRKVNYGDPPEADNIEIRERDQKRTNNS